MATTPWPSSDDLREPSSINPGTTKFRYKSEFEGGYTQVSPKYTKPKRQFELTWGSNGDHHVLSHTQMMFLLQFFEDHGADVLEWTNRDDGNIM